MRKVWLNREDFGLFHQDITPFEYEFFRAHSGAFKRMWQEQVSCSCSPAWRHQFKLDMGTPYTVLAQYTGSVDCAHPSLPIMLPIMDVIVTKLGGVGQGTPLPQLFHLGLHNTKHVNSFMCLFYHHYFPRGVYHPRYH